MKIDPVKTEHVTSRTSIESRPKQPGRKDVARDEFTAQRKERLLGAIKAEPPLRPGATERAQRLAADPNYPSADVIFDLAEHFVNSVTR
jgi:hypothetical protein